MPKFQVVYKNVDKKTRKMFSVLIKSYTMLTYNKILTLHTFFILITFNLWRNIYRLAL